MRLFRHRDSRLALHRTRSLHDDTGHIFSTYHLSTWDGETREIKIPVWECWSFIIDRDRQREIQNRDAVGRGKVR